MAMVVRANRDNANLGGHISTYASSATLYEVGYNHFFRAPSNGHPGDQIYFQGHAAPGIMPAPFSKGVSASTSWKTSVASCKKAVASPPIRTPG